MCKYLNAIAIFFKKIAGIIKNAFVSFFGFLKMYFKNDKKSIAVQVVLFFVSLLSFSSTAMFTSFFKSNISTNLQALAVDYETETGAKPNIVVHYNQTIQTYDDIVYSDPELSREIRNVFNTTCFDLYGGWDNNLGTPGIVDYVDYIRKPITFIKWPKFSYSANYWLYDMPLETSNNIPSNSTPNDIYINTKYADKLLVEFGVSDYNSLVDKTITIPYLKKAKISSDGISINVKYVIRGVLSNSDKYNSISDLFGDFFIVSELLSLPIPSYTYVKLKTVVECRKIFDFLLDKYDYETNRSYLGSNASQETFQCRIDFFGNIESKYSIKYIEKDMHKYSVKTNKLFDCFVGSANSVQIIIGLLFFCFCYILQIVFAINSIMALNQREANITANFKYLLFFEIILYVVEIGLGLFIGKLLTKWISKFAVILINPISLLFVLIELSLIVTISIVFFVKTKKNQK